MLLFLCSFALILFIFFLGCTHDYWQKELKNEFKHLTKNETYHLIGIFTALFISFPAHIVIEWVSRCIHFCKDYIRRANQEAVENHNVYTGLPNYWGLYHSAKHLKKIFPELTKKTIREMAVYADSVTIGNIEHLFKEGDFSFLDRAKIQMEKDINRWHYNLNTTMIGNVAYIHEFLSERTAIFKDNYQTLQPYIEICRAIIDDFKNLKREQLVHIQNIQIREASKIPTEGLNGVVGFDNDVFFREMDNIFKHPSVPK